MELTEIKSKVLDLIDRGSLGEDILKVLSLNQSSLINHETELWDYKSAMSQSKLDIAEFVRDTLAFYNSFGGYIIYGVSDDGDTCGCDEINEQTCKQAIRNYTGSDIQITIKSHNINGKSIQLAHIPKRPITEVPIAISRNGPDITERKTIFKPGDVFFRSNDSSQLIRGSDDLRFLMGERRHSNELEPGKSIAKFIPNNLPDRSIIFNKFFGREAIKEELWTWLADPMSRYRVLAGPGGVGKTSAAYNFCESVCAETPLGLEQVVWLSAKRQQFSPSKNEKINLPYKADPREFGESYSCYDTLLSSISYHFAISDDEWSSSDHGLKVRMLSEGLSIIPTLIIVDDLDSLTPDDQRKAVELGMSLGNSKSRFLFTTRKNYLAPLSSTTEIKGLAGDDFISFVSYLQEIYSRNLSNSELKTLAQDTEGSPLFTESIFRLLKLGNSFSEALSRWKGKDGEAVRAASFRRELEQLPWGAKRVLYAISMFETVSNAEIRQLTESELSEVEAAIGELDRLFLVQNRQIGGQARFGVAPNLRRLLQDLKTELVPNHAEISRRAANLRSENNTGQQRGKSKAVANAIQQAMAQLSGGDPSGALLSIEEVLKEHESSADLWMVYARCLAAMYPRDVSKIRSAFQKSYDLGKREPQLFIKWIDFETSYGNSNAAVDVGEKGRSAFQANDWRWLKCLATAHLKRGFERDSRREYGDALSDFQASAKHLKKAIKHCPFTTKALILLDIQKTNDAIWKTSSQPSQFSIIDHYKNTKAAAESGDTREICIQRLLSSFEYAVREPSFKTKNISTLKEWQAEIRKIIEKHDSSMLTVKFREICKSIT